MTSDDWLRKLGKALDDRLTRLSILTDYYEGRHRLAYSSQRFRSAFGNLFSTFSDNFCELVVDSAEERLNVEGFRFSEPSGDAAAWEIWQRNAMDAESQLAHASALVNEQAYVLIWADREGMATMTVEAATQMIVAHSASNRRSLLAGLKRWVDDSGYLFATLYLPDRIEKYRSKGKVDPTSLYLNLETVEWEAREVDNEAWPLPNPLGVVPIVPLVNNPRLDGTGRSEIEAVVPIQDAVNKLVADMLIASEFGSFRQRWATGIEIPADPETNEPIEPFRIAVDRLLISENEAARFGEFGQTDLAPYVKAVEMLIQHVASITRTPPHYFLASMGNFPSGESLKSAETGLVSKVRRKMRHYGEAWESVMRLAFTVEDDPKGKAVDAETIWRNPESRTEAEHVDAVLKQAALGIPQVALWEELGYTPQQIDRFKQLRAQEALEVGAAFDPFLDAPQP